MHRKVAGAILALALAFAGVAGCGGDKSPTKAEFVRQVDTACKAKAPKSSTASRTRGPEHFLGEALAQQRAVAKGLDGIKAPDELDADYATFKKTIRDRAAIFEEALTQYKANPKVRLEGLSREAERAQRKLARVATSLGVDSCS